MSGETGVQTVSNTSTTIFSLILFLFIFNYEPLVTLLFTCSFSFFSYQFSTKELFNNRDYLGIILINFSFPFLCLCLKVIVLVLSLNSDI